MSIAVKILCAGPFNTHSHFRYGNVQTAGNGKVSSVRGFAFGETKTGLTIADPVSL